MLVTPTSVAVTFVCSSKWRLLDLVSVIAMTTTDNHNNNKGEAGS